LASAAFANAATNLTPGSVGFVPFGAGGNFTANSVNFVNGSSKNFANYANGGFSGLVTTFDISGSAVSIYSGTVSGIAYNTPTSISVANFITFGSGTGPTPQQFAFDLTSIKITSLTGHAGEGYGVLRDTSGTYNDANAEFSYSFLSPNNYSISFVAAPIPEPSTYAAMIAAMTLGIVAIRRRKQAVA
jgi:hypothetical protein